MEKKTETKNRGWIVASVALMLLSACLTASIAFALSHNNKALSRVERAYEQSLYDLSDNLNNIEVNLSKLMVAPGGTFAATLLTDVYSEALAAEKAFSALPVDAHEAEKASAFFNQIADFSVSYQRALISGTKDLNYSECLENMYVTARQLNAEINDSVMLVSQHKMDIRKITSARPFTFRVPKDTTVTHNSIEYPELIYDGPFSDGRADEEYRHFEGTESITLKEAKDVAAAALADYKVQKITSAGKSVKEPLFELSVSCERGDAYVSVSEHGGKIVNLSVSRPLGKVMLGEESAKACAREFAQKLGYEVEPVWYQTVSGMAYVNLAPVENDVVLYTDLVKVKVALDNGEVLGLEAKNYCLNHCEHNTTLTMNKNAVPTLIDSRLQLQSVRGALIPLENGGERLCYEAVSEYKGLTYFVYLDAADGETVKIMRTVDTDQGSLVM